MTNLYEFEDYEDYIINEQEEGSIITVSADVCEYIDDEDSVDMLKCDAY